MKKVVAALDNSPAATSVLLASSSLAKLLDADVEALHVSDTDARTARASASALGIPYRQLSGDPLTCISQQACAGDVVAVALGARARRTARHAGHLARELADRIDRPILVVPPDTTDGGEFHTVVVAMEGSPKKARSLKGAIDLVADADLKLIVVHVDDEESIPSFSDQVAYEAEAYAKEFLARYVNHAPDVHLKLRVGVPADEILDVTDDVDADLLAVGWPQPATKGRGAVARELLDRSRVPLLLVAVDTTKDP